MSQSNMRIQMLGEFSVYLGDVCISDAVARSKKLWLILKYLIANRHKLVTTESLIDILWPDDQPANPLKLLYTHISRLRKLIQSEDDEEQHIIYRQNGYQWNTSAAVEIDVVSFERLVKNAKEASGDDERLPLLTQAVELYKGDYLAESAIEAWVLPIMNYYKRMYLRAVCDLADIYGRNAAYGEVISLCNSAVQMDPYEEEMHERLIRALLMNGDIKQARRQYRFVADLMYKEFGALPSDGILALYEEMQDFGDATLDLAQIESRLESPDTRGGALFCTSDMFKQIYLIDKRSKRMPFPVFLSLITVSRPEVGTLDDKHLKRIMNSLRKCLMRTLRQGDIVSQYSKSQYLMMLTAQQPKDAEAAIARVRRLFALEHSDEECVLEIRLSQVGRESSMLRSS